MPRKQKKYHFIYKTTNLVNNKFYVGMHSTDNLEDGYFGSGKIVHYSVNKHGIENHKVEILEFLPSREELKKREAEVVNEELLSDPLCMNLKFGGEGGWDHVNDGSGKCQSDAGKIGGKSCWEQHRENLTTITAKNLAETRKSKDWNSRSFLGKRHSEETKNKIREQCSENSRGEKNSQFDTCWIFNEVESKKVKKDDLQRWIDAGWNKGRKLNRAIV